MSFWEDFTDFATIGITRVVRNQKEEQKKAETQAQFQNLQQQRKERAIQAKEIRRGIARSRVAQAQALAQGVATQGTAAGSVTQGAVGSEQTATVGNIRHARNISNINRGIFTSQLQQQKYQRRADVYAGQLSLGLQIGASLLGQPSMGAALGQIGFNALKNDDTPTGGQ